MGMIFKVTLEVTTDPADWDPPEDVPTIRRELLVRELPNISSSATVRGVRERFHVVLDDTIRELVNHP